MGLFRSNDGSKFSKIQEETEETEPLNYSEAIEMTEAGQNASSSTSSDDRRSHNPPIYRKIGRIAEEGWTSVANLVSHPPRTSTHIEVDDPAPALPEITNDMKRNLYLLLEEPASSKSAFWTNVIVSFLIVFSAVTTTIETIPSFRSAKSNRVWFHLESTMVALFTLEYLLRMFAHSDSFRLLKKFFLSPLSIIDFISIVPFYIEVIAKHDTTYEFRFTILRLFRLLRLFKSYKYSNAIVMTLEVMMMAFRRSGDALSALFFFTVTSVVLFSTLLYFAERGIWDETLQTFVDSEGSPSSFDSIPATFWFVLVTITTTGYGDMVPTTFIGKLITFPAMMFGVLLIALPSIIVGRNFTIVWEGMRRRQFSNRLGLAPVGIIGDDILATGIPHHSTSIDNQIRQSVESSHPNSNDPNESTADFRLLPKTSDEEILNQIQSLMTLTLQNQAAINRIMNVLEKQGVAQTSPVNNFEENNDHHPTSSKGKGRMTTKIDTNPFD